MSNIVPIGEDQATGVPRKLQAGDSLVNASGNSASGLPKRYIEGLAVGRNNSTDTQLVVTAGSCRNSANGADIELSSQTIGDTTTTHSAANGFAQLNGVDEKGLDNLLSGSITCSQTTNTITATGDITPHYNPRAITGTISATGTALTGSGTSFRSELWIGDLVGTSTTYGWSRVIAVLSDTSATLVLAFPGGDPTSISAEVIHSATIWAGTVTDNKQVVRTINAAGTSIVVFANATVSASSPLTLGTLPDNSTPDDFAEATWVFVWVIDDGTTPGILLSTQHEELLAPPSGYTSFRRVGALLWLDAEDAPAGFRGGFYADTGHYRKFSVYANSLQQINSSTFGVVSFYPGFASSNPQYAPRTAVRIWGKAECVNTSLTNNNSITMGPTFASLALTAVVPTAQRLVSGELARAESAMFDIDVAPGQAFNFQQGSTSGHSVVLLMQGFYDSL